MPSNDQPESPAIVVEDGGSPNKDAENGAGDAPTDEVSAEALEAVAEMQEEFDKIKLETPKVDL